MVMDLRDASVLANADVQRRMFYEVTLFPLVRMAEKVLNALFQEDLRFFERARLRFAWEQVDVLQEDNAAVSLEARSNYEAGGITLNEYRQAIGQEPVEDGDEFKKPAPSPFAGLPFGGGAPTDDDDETDDDDDDEEKRFRPTKRVISSEVKRMARAHHESMRDSFVPRMLAALKRFFTEQRERIIARAEEYATRNAPKSHRTGTIDDSFLEFVYDLDFENAELFRLIGPIYLDAAVGAGKSAIASLIEEVRAGGPLSITADHERIQRAFAEFGATQIVQVNEETKASVRDVLVESFSEGYEHPRTIANINEKLGSFNAPSREGFQSRAERIADTEINRALNIGAHEAAQAVVDAGGGIEKTWLSSRDARVRESHRIEDDKTSGESIPIDQAFSNGLMFPNDPAGPASETVNCRCSMIEVLTKEPEQ
jgi:hypothetical protein